MTVPRWTDSGGGEVVRATDYDAVMERAERAEEACRAWMAKDTEALLDTLTIIGIPARDLADIYRLQQDWRINGGDDRLLKRLREVDRLRARVAELEADRA